MVHLNRLAPVSRRPGEIIALDLGLWILTQNGSKKMAKVSWEKDPYMIYIYVYLHMYKIWMIYYTYVCANQYLGI